MKKVSALILAIVLIMSVALPVYAVPSAEAKPEDLVPEITTSTDTGIILTPGTEAETLPEAAQKEYQEAVESLSDAVTSTQKVESVTHVTLSEGTEKATITIQPKNIFEPAVKQYVDGEWVDKEVAINADGTVDIKELENGTMVIVQDLVPAEVMSETKAVAEEDLTPELQTVAATAIEDLANELPEGMLVRNYFYAETKKDGTEDEVKTEFIFKTKSFQNMVVKQFVDGKWVELEYTVAEDGTVTVFGVIDGFLAVIVN